MPRQVVFHRLAAAEYRRARNWYGERSPEVAERFRAAVDRAVTRIIADEEALPYLLGQYRWIRAGGFPYVLIIRPQAVDTTMVVAIAHTSRRPGYWRKRS